MNTRTVLPVSLAALPLTGCATMQDQQQASIAEVHSALLSQPVAVQPLEQSVALTEHTKGQAVANTVIASMAATAAANMGIQPGATHGESDEV